MEQRTVTFTGTGGVTLVGDEWGERDAPSVLLLHGGGQTRHSWKDAGSHLAREGLHVVALDLRGHGDSDWAPDGHYELDDLRDDILSVLPQLGAPVTLIGASLGGMTTLLATAARPDLVHRLVLVDIVVRIEPQGVDRIRDFMHGAPNGFATLEEAAEAVAAYLPHREKPRSAEGLRKNLRLRDGRWHWHWDPKLFESRRDRKAQVEQLDAAARAVTVPTLLVRGGQSDIVSDAGVEHLQELISHVEVATMADAAHTAAADDNDAFTLAVVDFVLRPDGQESPASR